MVNRAAPVNHEQVCERHLGERGSRGARLSRALLAAAGLSGIACAALEEPPHGREGPGNTPNAVAPALQSSCGYVATTGNYGVWSGGYQSWVRVSNVEGPVATEFQVWLDLGGSTLADGYMATFSPAEEGRYHVFSPSWLQWQRIPVGGSFEFGFVGQGAPSAVTPYVISVNGERCDTSAPELALAVNQRLFTSPGVLQLTATATDDVAVAGVTFRRDGEILGVDRTAPYTLEVSVTDALNGYHRYSATAIDPSGNEATAEKRVRIAIGERFLGSAPDSPADYTTFTPYFNQVTPENGGKWGTVEAVRDEMDWTQLDAAFEFAQANGFPFKHHALVWGQQQPSWLAELPPEEQLEELREWMELLADRYGDVEMIDVVNEPLHAPPSYTEALGGAGETGWDWMIRSFELAREYFPNSELILNDYQILMMDEFTTEYLTLIELLQERDLIDAIGEQGHFLERAETDVVEANLARLAATGLPLYISEFDVNIADDALHANRLRDLFTVFWENASVIGVTHWGHLEGSVWRPQAYLVRTDGTERPGLEWLMCYIRELGYCTVPEYVPAPRTGGEYGIVLEAEEYDDGAGIAALGGVVAYTDDGDWVRYDRVVFQDDWDRLWVTYSKGNEEVGSISIHLDELASEPLVTVPLPSTGGWGTSSTLEIPWVPISGERDVFVRFNAVGSVGNLDSIRFGRPLPAGELVANGDFEAGIGGWSTWGGVLTATTNRAHGGAQSLLVSARTQGAGTAAYDITNAVIPGALYQASFWVTIGGAASAPVNVTAKIACAGESDAYPWLANSASVPDGEWVELTGALQVPDCDLTQLQVYVEGPPAGVDLYVDDVSIAP